MKILDHELREYQSEIGKKKVQKYSDKILHQKQKD